MAPLARARDAVSLPRRDPVKSHWRKQ